ncbi:MBL fold metallo-hydrolase [Haladaptatus salinisoli]|uniref:MBL fold metallo-hydrolase n=1 Tax=Haladaptatus salinisoli TaxID=2884876 RepID=UPI001D0A6BCA|nr:MBL fold metallo-hydrolase [Haladaptatus salinisoli]
MSETTITFAGSGDTLGSGGRLQTCIHTDADSTQFLLDCGASSLPALKRHEIDLNAIDAILLTHLHGDHFGGIPFFVLDAQLVSKRTDPLIIAGPPGTEKRVRAAMDVMFPGLSEVNQEFEISYVELEDREETMVGSLRVTPYRVVHPSGAPPYALRVVVDDSSIAYSGDTEWTDALVDAARGTDVFICEAYFFDREVPYHISYDTLHSHYAELECDRTIITHMSEEMLSRLPDIELEHADDGKQITI